MPAGKKQDAMTLTFSRKNKDVYDFLEESKKDKGFVATDYICEAVRFYNANKGSINNISMETINDLIEMKLLKLGANIQVSEEAVDKLVYAEQAILETNIEGVDIDDD